MFLFQALGSYTMRLQYALITGFFPFSSKNGGPSKTLESSSVLSDKGENDWHFVVQGLRGLILGSSESPLSADSNATNYSSFHSKVVENKAVLS